MLASWVQGVLRGSLYTYHMGPTFSLSGRTPSPMTDAADMKKVPSPAFHGRLNSVAEITHESLTTSSKYHKVCLPFAMLWMRG